MEQSPQKTTKRTVDQKAVLLNRLKRIEGQIRGLARLVETDTYCNDILQQSISARSALDGFNRELLGLHIRSCVSEGIKRDDDEVIDELLDTLRKLMK
ncbi:MAG: metal-sensing transcriptional repressor [Lachnospiraceae bacterium]|nr:metal-sensing transcriptional repressor [Lachnospiraceae bacterium]MDY5742684.1 metal-sensing transcriptional repressor [Lachnospiraceae bacterium]